MATAESTATPNPSTIEAVEEALATLRQARPHLEERIGRAEHILVAHLASPRQGVIRARVRSGKAGGHHRYLVKSLGNGGAVYVVDPRSYSCSCPDYHRRGKVCKHGLAAFILERAGSRA